MGKVVARNVRAIHHAQTTRGLNRADRGEVGYVVSTNDGCACRSSDYGACRTRLGAGLSYRRAAAELRPDDAVWATVSNGANLAADHINADKLLSKPFSINHEDSQGQPQAAVTAMNKLVRVNQEPMVLTAMSGISKAIAPIGEREKVVAINGGGVAPDLARLGPYFFNTIPLVNYEVRALLPYLNKEKKVKRIALVYVEDPLGEACLNELKENAPKSGMELVGAFSVPSTS